MLAPASALATFSEMESKLSLSCQQTTGWDLRIALQDQRCFGSVTYGALRNDLLAQIGNVFFGRRGQESVDKSEANDESRITNRGRYLLEVIPEVKNGAL